MHRYCAVGLLEFAGILPWEKDVGLPVGDSIPPETLIQGVGKATTGVMAAAPRMSTLAESLIRTIWRM